MQMWQLNLKKTCISNSKISVVSRITGCMSLNKRIMKTMKECQFNYCHLDCIFYFRHLIIIITRMPEEALNISYSYHISALQNFLDKETVHQRKTLLIELLKDQSTFPSLFVCQAVYLSFCLSVCLPVCLSACLPARLPVCISIYHFMVS